MDIGIITLHFPLNYGAVLQAYALNNYLNAAGYEAYTIDYKTEIKQRKTIKNTIVRLFSVFRKKKLAVRGNRFHEFVNTRIRLSKRIASKEELSKLNYGKYICGSDQIWNPLGRGRDDAYFLSFVHEPEKKIAYAPSIGVSSLPDCEKEYLKRVIDTFSCISVREEEGKRLLGAITDKEISVVCDPVFLLSKESWQSLMKPVGCGKKYILLYFLHNAGELTKKAVEFARRNDYEVITVGTSIREVGLRCRKRFDAGPIEFISLINEAEMIFTNSFHGTAMSIILQKNFAVSPIGADINGSSNSRINTLLEKTGLTERNIYYNSFEKLIEKSIDYSDVSKKLNPFIEYSKSYLKQSLGK